MGTASRARTNYKAKLQTAWPDGNTDVVMLWWLWLQDAGAHPVSSWAVQVVLPALCGLWRLCRSTALGLQEGGLAVA